MSRVRQQRYRVGEQAKRKLHCNESQIEADANRKGCAEVCRSVNVPGPMRMVMVGRLSLHSMIVIYGYPFNLVPDTEAPSFTRAASRPS